MSSEDDFSGAQAEGLLYFHELCQAETQASQAGAFRNRDRPALTAVFEFFLVLNCRSSLATIFKTHCDCLHFVWEVHTSCSLSSDTCFDIGFDFKIVGVSYRSQTEERLLLDGDGRCFDLSGFHKDRMITTSMTFHFNLQSYMVHIEVILLQEHQNFTKTQFATV